MSQIQDSLYRYAVIAATYKGKWVFCRNRTRQWELPGGHREEGEAIVDTAKRELYEETGARLFDIRPICAYSVHNYGLLFYADIKELGPLPESEIERIDFFEELPQELSFPTLHPKHLAKVIESLRD